MTRFLAALSVALFALAGAAHAQVPPPITVTPTIQKQKVNADTYKAKLKVTVKVPGLLTNTLETEWVTLKKQKPVAFPTITIPAVKVSGSFEWTGSKIKVSGKVEVGSGSLKRTKSFSAEVQAQ